MTSEAIESNKQVALRFLDLTFGMKMHEAIPMLSDDASWWLLGDPERIKAAGLKNKEQTVRALSNMKKLLPHGMRYRVFGVTAEADRVAVEVEAEGRWHDGRIYRNTYHFLFRIRGNQVASIREYLDTMQLL